MQLFIEGTWQQIATNGDIRLRLVYCYVVYKKTISSPEPSPSELPDPHLQIFKVSRNQY